ncbi:hypothetical protein AA313_de0205017 [Arthrobotrys entomopaga]|nr:hypothetical protein AA313_de0205017 [Arthrobotrys entomopaga]
MVTTFLNFLMIGFTTDINSASVFRLDGTKLTSGSTHGTMNASQYGYVFMQPATPLQGLTDISCTMSATRQILCTHGTSTEIVQAGSDPVLALSDSATVSNQNLPLIQLTALE